MKLELNLPTNYAHHFALPRSKTEIKYTSSLLTQNKMYAWYLDKHNNFNEIWNTKNPVMLIKICMHEESSTICIRKHLFDTSSVHS